MPLMKHSITLTLFLILFCSNFILGQTTNFSKHEFNFYIDDLQQSTANAEISIVVSGDTIFANKTENFYYFPIVDTSKYLDIIVKVSELTFLGQEIKSWVLNRGTKIILGKLTNLKNLQSVAEYSGMTKNDKGWESYSKRFFVLDHYTTLDIDNRDKINELHYLLVYPKNSSKHVSMQKTIK